MKQTGKQHKRIQTLVQMAALIAIMLVLELVGLGMIKIGVLEMTILQVPVIIGAITMGPMAGAALGGVFGLISFWECFGKSYFGSVLLGVNPFLTFLVCVPTRILMGWLCGLIFRAINRSGRFRLLPFASASLAGALLNTALFMTTLMLCFGRTQAIQDLQGGMHIIPFVFAFVGVQGLVEALLSAFLGTAISKGLCAALRLQGA